MSRDKIIYFHVCIKIGHFWCWKLSSHREWFLAHGPPPPAEALYSTLLIDGGLLVPSAPMCTKCDLCPGPGDASHPPLPRAASLIDFICTEGVYPEPFAPAKDCCWEERFASPQWSLYIVQSGLPCIPDVLTVLIPLLSIILMDSC